MAVDSDLRKMVRDLVQQRALYQEKIVLIDLQLYNISRGMSAPSKQSFAEVESQKIESKPKLDALVYKLLINNKMGLDDIVAKVRNVGYPTKAENFVGCVRQSICKLKAVGALEVKRDPDGRKYQSISGISDEDLSRKLASIRPKPSK